MRALGDLKPENLLFTTTADDAVLKLTDFGFAKEGRSPKRTHHHTYLLLRRVGNNEQQPLNTPW